MKKKIILSLLLIVALVTVAGCGKKEEKKDNKEALAFKEEYEALNGKMARFKKEHRILNIPEDNPYVKTTPAKVLEMIENKQTFYLYVGDPLCPWCRSVIEQSIETAKSYGIDKIYYIDFWDDENKEILRDVYELVDGKITKTVEETEEYKKLLDLCGDDLGLRNYTVKDKNGKEVEVNSKRFFGPTFLYVQNGVFKKYTDARSSKQAGPLDELTEEIKKDMDENFGNFFVEVCDDAC